VVDGDHENENQEADDNDVADKKIRFGLQPKQN
jgi:hypothetical protein